MKGYCHGFIHYNSPHVIGDRCIMLIKEWSTNDYGVIHPWKAIVAMESMLKLFHGRVF